MSLISFDFEANIEQQFDRVAQQLLLETSLVVNGKTYQLTEIEFYVSDNIHKSKEETAIAKLIHPDPFVHGHALQKTSNQWYFHSAGIDITIGNEKCYGGILLRGLKTKDENGGFIYYDGPLNILREVFKQINLEYSHLSFGLKKSALLQTTIWKSTRIGLNDYGQKFRKKYQQKLYRYLIDCHLSQHKYKEKRIVKDYDIKIEPC